MLGCFSPETRATQGLKEGILHIGNGAEPQDLDPHVITGFTEHKILFALFEGLVDLDEKTLEPIPAVAESWQVSGDGLIYTFTLRRTAAWSNGDPVTAHDFVYAWQRILSPALGSEYSYMLYCIRNAKEYNEGNLQDPAQIGVTALDDHTLRVTLVHPTPYLLSMQIHNSFFPVHKPTIERFGGIDERGTKWTQAGNLVGNGPFMLTRWEPNRIISLAKNPHYWDAAHVRLNGAHFYPIDSQQTEERAFRRGELHTTSEVPLNKIEVYKRSNPDLIHTDPFLGTYFYRFNVTRPPFDDARVRRAFAMAIDRKTLVEKVTKGSQQPAGCLTPPDTAGYTCASAIPYNAEEAGKLLAEAGHPQGRGLPPIELLYNTSESHKLIAEAIQQMWKEHLGVEVSLVNQDWKVYLASMGNLDYQIARSAWIGDYLDPNSFLDCFVTGGGNNRTGYASPVYDKLIARAAQTAEQQQRFAVFQEAEQVLLNDAPIAPIYFYTRVYLKVPELKGWEPNILGHVRYKNLYFENAPDATRQEP
jgi:oligopeptide transport system substrate-binding protein